MATKRKKKPVQKSSRKKNTKSKSAIIWIFLIVFFLVISFFYFTSSSRNKKNNTAFFSTIPAGYNSFGIDVSHHQGEINWEFLFKQKEYDTIIKFVYCKATQGNSHVDKRWDKNRATLNNLGVLNGAYHFFQSKDKPKPQVEHFLKHWKKREVDLPPVLDVESEGLSDIDLRAKMTIWLEEVENKTGMRPIIYTSLHFFTTKFVNYFPNYKFWIASYSKEPHCIDDKRILYWQYSESGTLPGINEKVDFNVSKTFF